MKFPVHISSDKLRIALVLTELRAGGMEKVVVHLAKGLAKRNLEVLVVCLQTAGQLASELDDDKRISLVALNSFTGKDFRAILRLRQLFAQLQPSIINIHDYSSLPYVALSNALAKRVPVLFTAHGLLYEGFEQKKRINRFFSRFITKITAVSAKVSDRHCDYLGWNKPVEIIANGVPENLFENSARERIRQELRCKPDEFLFLAVGNPRPEKGFEDLIEAFAHLHKDLSPDSGFMVAVAGEMNQSDYCRSLLRRVAELNLKNRFKFLGYRDDVSSLYRAADAFVLSSRSEGLPMVILEAMISGLPLIATRVGGVPDAVAGQALLVESGAPAQLAEAMQRLMEDDNLRECLGHSGRKQVRERFGVDRMVDGYMKTYRDVLSQV